MALAWYLTGVIAIITLVPLEFRWPSTFRLVGFTTVADLVQNVALFLPLGFFIGFAHRGRALVVGLAFSVLVELVQQFIPGRSPSLLDVATNTVGAWTGGALHHRLEGLLDRQSKSAGIRALDLPLMGLGYLMVPLLWLAGLGAQSDPARRWLVALPGLSIAIVVASVSRHHLEPREFSRARTALLGGAAVAVGLIPGWYNDPGFLIGGAAVVTILIWVFAALLVRLEPLGRRFEIPTVQRAMGPFAVYLALTAVWPLGAFGGPWSGGPGFSHPVHALGHIGILRLLELIAAVSVVGYSVAEVAGRSATQRQHRPMLAVAAAVGTGLALLRGFHPGQGASAIEALLLGAATWVGAELYWRQRAFVRARLGRLDVRVDPAERVSYGRMEPVPAGEGAP